MLASLVLFLASIAPASAAPPAAKSADFRPASGATATATVSIRIISGVRFGPNHSDGDGIAARRKARLPDAAGQLRDAELLEFQ
jgi:hypothetical protein